LRFVKVLLKKYDMTFELNVDVFDLQTSLQHVKTSTT